MKIKNRILTMLGIIVAGVFMFGLAAAATGGYGTSSDPLVTLSYITDVFTPEMNKTVSNTVNTKASELKTELDDTITALESKYAAASTGIASSSYNVVTIPSGTTLTGKKGCEIMLRVGSAHCVAAASPGLVDSTNAEVLENGKALVKNHMYMVTIDGRGVKADGEAMVIVRGDYSIA